LLPLEDHLLDGPNGSLGEAAVDDAVDMLDVVVLGHPLMKGSLELPASICHDNIARAKVADDGVQSLRRRLLSCVRQRHDRYRLTEDVDGNQGKLEHWIMRGGVLPVRRIAVHLHHVGYIQLILHARAQGHEGVLQGLASSLSYLLSLDEVRDLRPRYLLATRASLHLSICVDDGPESTMYVVEDTPDDLVDICHVAPLFTVGLPHVRAHAAMGGNRYFGKRDMQRGKRENRQRQTLGQRGFRQKARQLAKRTTIV
jgi:hypothetical protein